jgi:predicted dienelactone hydrolase
VITRTEQNDPERCLEVSGDEQERFIEPILQAWATDMAFVLDRLAALNTDDPSGTFTGRLDLSRVGVFGLSLGGAEAAQFCHKDPRCKAGVDVDGALHGTVIEAGINRPFMFLLSDHSGSPTLKLFRSAQTFDRFMIDFPRTKEHSWRSMVPTIFFLAMMVPY